MTMRTLIRSSACGMLLAGWLQVAGADVSVVSTSAFGPFVGFEADLHSGNQYPNTIAMLGTDLGFSYKHGDHIKFLFGDTWSGLHWLTGEPTFISSVHDDVFGSVDTTDPAWDEFDEITESNIPKILLGQVSGSSQAKGINPGHYMDPGKTPIGGFSSGTREYGVFILERSLGCAQSSECSTMNDALTCDKDIGWWTSFPWVGAPWNQQGFMFLCMDDGFGGCTDETKRDFWGNNIPDTGFCTDVNSTVHTSADGGRMASVALQLRIARRSTNAAAPELYNGGHVDWVTNRFYNSAYNTVQDFRPTDLAQKDYNPAGSSGSYRRVFIWGRPGFFGINALNRNLGLYFAYVDMPSDSTLDWTVNYFTHVDEYGVPHFSNDEAEAVPLDLSSTTAGKASSWEDHDNVGQMSVVWVDHFDKWVMFYGGGTLTEDFIDFTECGLLELFVGEDCDQVSEDDLETQAIYMRTADHPWGPWSEPVDVLVGGNPYAANLEGEFQPGGILYHPECEDDLPLECRESDPGSNENHPGYLYAPNIIHPWIDVVDADEVELIWNVSTWNPYSVTLMKTRLIKN